MKIGSGFRHIVVTTFMVFSTWSLTTICLHALDIAGSSYALEPLRDETLLIDASAYHWDAATENLVVSLFSGAEPVWQQQLRTSEDVRAEIFDPFSGVVISNQAVVVDNGRRVFQVSPPFGLEYDSLILLATSADKKARELARISKALVNSNFEAPTILAINSTSARQAQGGDSDSLEVSQAPFITTILDNGPPENRVDILLLGDGYTDSEMLQWHIDAEAAMYSILSEAPFSDYKSYFNVHRIDAVSNESGVSHPELDVSKDTFFDAYYNCGNVQRLICIGDFNYTVSVIDSLIDVGQDDIIILIVNDPVYGGSGGRIAVASTNTLAAEILLHEIGHSFGNLADEYDAPLSANIDCEVVTAITQANVSSFTDIEQVKWKHWLDIVKSIPTPYKTNTSDPGFYAGARYCKNLYRPTPNSKMRNLGRPFDAVNEEALILRLYDYVSAVDDYYPAIETVDIHSNEIFNFEVNVLNPENHALDISWYRNGQALVSGPSLNSGLLGAGTELVSVVVTDTTSKVRMDSENKLVFEKTWQISGSESLAARPRFENNIAYLPYVKIEEESKVYAVELTRITESPVQFLLTAVQARNPSGEPVNAASMGLDKLLTIESIAVEGIDYRVTMRLIDTEPEIIFQLESAQETHTVE